MLSKSKILFFTIFLSFLVFTGCPNFNYFKNPEDINNEESNTGNDVSEDSTSNVTNQEGSNSNGSNSEGNNTAGSGSEGDNTGNSNNQELEGIAYVKQNIDYNDSNLIIYNPDMGFYSAYDLEVLSDGVYDCNWKCIVIRDEEGNKTNKYEGSYSNKAKFDLLHLKFDLSAFSDNAIRAIDDEGKTTKGKTGELTEAALDGIDKILQAVEDAGKTSIVRFCYDYKYQGQKKYADANNNVITDNLIKATNDKEPQDSNGYKLYVNTDGDTEYADVEPNPEDFQIILKHINDIAPLLIKHRKSITAIECGMIGPYGEMHSTTLAKDRDSEEFGYIVDVMDTFLSALGDTKIPFLVRQPAFLKAYLNNHANNEKLGLYNDGYLGSGSDLGTFKGDRATEIEYLKPFTEKTPYGGELCFDDSKKKNGLWREGKLDSTVNEMYDVHLSFLNIGWNYRVLEWADSDDHYYSGGGITITDNNIVRDEKFFQYLIKHMGYRFVVTDSQIGMDSEKNTAGFKLSFVNNGFANIPYHRQKVMTVIFVKDEEKVLEQTGSALIFEGNEKEFSKNFTVDISSLPEGEYDVFLKISDDDKNYPIELANTGIWNGTLKANKIGIITK